MKKTTFLGAVFGCVAALCAVGVGFAQDADAKKTSGNPVFPGWYADPEVAMFDGKYWIFPTYSAAFDDQTFFDCFSSTDLVNWTKHERVLTNEEVKWARRAMWAPSVVEKDGK
ncbi:MAG: family 43 glycosylhydrolase [Thermoguttaceae bacterium]|nr:family 43 glycosylhydrolase [Thermoguttaceae bacterium]